ncbi:MAG: hypothetical protein ACFFC7_03820 [Candidatus Hermodarchaeota archaeon]
MPCRAWLSRDVKQPGAMSMTSLDIFVEVKPESLSGHRRGIRTTCRQAEDLVRSGLQTS